MPLSEGDALPTTRVQSYQAEVVHHQFSGETGVALIVVAISGETRVSLCQRLHAKFRKAYPRGRYLRALPDFQLQATNGQRVGDGSNHEVYVFAAAQTKEGSTSLPPTQVPIDAKCQPLRAATEPLLYADPPGLPRCIACHLIFGPHRLLLEHSYCDSRQQPALFCS